MDLQLDVPHPSSRRRCASFDRGASARPPRWAGRRGSRGRGTELGRERGQADGLLQQVDHLARLLLEQPVDRLAAPAGYERQLGRDLEADRVDVAVAHLQQPVRDVVVDVVAPRAPVPALRKSFALRSISFDAPPSGDRLQVVEDALVAVVHLVAALAGL